MHELPQASHRSYEYYKPQQRTTTEKLASPAVSEGETGLTFVPPDYKQTASKLASTAVDKGDKGSPSSGIRIFVPPCEPESPRPRHRDGNASCPVYRAPPAPADHDQRPTTQVSSAAGDNHATTVSEDMHQQPVSATTWHRQRPQSPAIRPTGVVVDNKQSAPPPPPALEKLPSESEEEGEANASQTIPTAPSMAARPSPAARPTPALAGDSGTTPSKKQRESSCCDRLLSCFGLCS